MSKIHRPLASLVRAIPHGAQVDGRKPAGATVDDRANFKTCTSCHRSKSLQEFWRDASTCDGLRRNCKYCCRIYDKYSKRELRRGLALVRT